MVETLCKLSRDHLGWIPRKIEFQTKKSRRSLGGIFPLRRLDVIH